MNDKQVFQSSPCNSPVVWFVVLERARQDNNFELAAKAKNELERLGIIVKYRKMVRLQSGTDNAC